MKGFEMTKDRFKIEPMNRSLETSVTVTVRRPFKGGRYQPVERTTATTPLYRFGKYKHLTYDEAVAKKANYDSASAGLRDGETLLIY
jgi:hypothetical protein